MTQLSPEQVAAYAYQAGFRGEDLVAMVGIISTRESGGRTDAHRTDLDPSRPSGDFGLAQVNSANVPWLVRKGIIANAWDLLDPAKNLAAAFALYQNGGNSLRPWAAVAGKGWAQGGNPLAGVNMTVARDAVARATASGMLKPQNAGQQVNLDPFGNSASTENPPGAQSNFPGQQTAGGPGTPTLDGGQPIGGDRLDPRFREPLYRMLAAAKAAGVDLRLGEGYRSPQQEEQDFRRKYTIDDSAGTITWQGHKWRHVSGLPGVPPGMGFHGAGLAADMVGDLNWMHAHIGEFGLQDFKDVNNDPVHIQLLSLPRGWGAYRKSADYRHSDNSAYDQANGFAGLPDPNGTLGNSTDASLGAALGPGANGANTTAGAAPGVIAGTGPGGAVTDNDLNNYVRKNYGFMAGFLDIPEIRDALFTAAKTGMGPDELQGLISKTQWWQTTSASARNWQKLISEDPAAAKAKVQENLAQISDDASKYGIKLTPEQLLELATSSAKFAWSGTQTIDNILRNVDFGGGGNVDPGQLTAMVDDIRATSAQYMIPVSEQTAQDYATRIARGQMTKDGVVSIFHSQAKARYSYMSDLIDQGVTPENYFGPSRDAIASELEMNPATINMTDPKWMSMIEVPGQNGTNRASTYNEARLSARKMPEWAKTKGASDMAANMVQGLKAAWGR